MYRKAILNRPVFKIFQSNIMPFKKFSLMGRQVVFALSIVCLTLFPYNNVNSFSPRAFNFHKIIAFIEQKKSIFFRVSRSRSRSLWLGMPKRFLLSILSSISATTFKLQRMIAIIDIILYDSLMGKTKF